MSGLSLYFHASLYVFKPKAVAVITAQFDEKVKGTGAKCEWLPQQEIFSLQCPQLHGTFCDEALGDIIAKYITTELEAAEREERDPDIVRYPQSRLDRVDTGPTEEQMEDEALLQPPPAHVRPVFTHIIVTGEGEGKQVKFFKMYELPEDFLRRILSPRTEPCRRLLSYGFTCRAVRWDAQLGYVFNGRDGKNAAVSTFVGGDFLSALTFPSMDDIRDRSESDVEEELAVHQWEHIDARAPRVEDWVRGVGETRQIVPEIEGEVVEKAGSKPTVAPLIDLGAEDPNQSDGESEDEIRTGQPLSFDDILSGPTIADRAKEESGNEIKIGQLLSFDDMLSGPTIADRANEDDSDDSGDSDEAISLPTKVPMTVPSRAAPAQRVDNRGWDAVLPKVAPQGQPVLQNRSNSAALKPLSTPPPAAPESFPDYGSAYSKVDDVGLLAPAAAQAMYEHHSRSARPTKSKARSVVPRATIRDESNTTPSASHESDDEVIDRLQTPDPRFAQRMNTMNQKAGKKGKGNNTSKAAGKKPAYKAQLPLPDPVPAPKPKKVVEAPKTISKSVISSSSVRSAATKKPVDAFSKLLANTLETQRQSNDEEDFDSDEETLTPKPRMKLMAQIGILLSRSEDKTLGSYRTVPPQELQEKLSSMSDDLKTDFLPRITSADSDAVYLNGIFEANGLQMEAFYEISILDIKSWPLKITVPAAKKSDFTIKARDRAMGYAFLHFPVRVWDARVTLVDPGLNHETASRDAIAEFVSSMSCTPGEAPSFRAFVPPGEFFVQRVTAIKFYSYDLDGMIYRLVKTQELETSGQSHRRHYNFVAKAAETREEMVASHRMWWEVRLETFDLQMAEQMQSRVDELVRSMDGVGLANVGPWEGNEEEVKEEILQPVRVKTGDIEW
ncbi:unnamed protein product [Zymoseptoria tritici ST99CH_1A5]|uniref:Uncharacterized protein n=1 Tax=Zymoseptoria tritici ST99CH_1A5 TaxID=1276529 RepID=A0A1Y6L9P0_ZYMTR|nr:unnamed protein product [Zymoseptoria tritici ST99CH_1A5]